MKSIFKQTLTESNLRGLVSQKENKTVCTIYKEGFKLEGTFGRGVYTSKIVNTDGLTIDEHSVDVKTSSALRGQIKESFEFFNNVVDSFCTLKEAEDDEPEDITPEEGVDPVDDVPTDDVPVDDVPTDDVPAEPVEEIPENTYSLAGELEKYSTTITEIGDSLKLLVSGLPEDDAVNKAVVVGFQSELYELAASIKEFQQDLLEVEE